MPRIFSGVFVAAALCLVPTVVVATSAEHGKRHAGSKSKHAWHGYGFLPGYRSPEQIERERAPAPTGVYFPGFPGYNFYGGPGFYRGRWNGGGFGPCWTQTPIGPHWNCG